MFLFLYSLIMVVVRIHHHITLICQIIWSTFIPGNGNTALGHSNTFPKIFPSIVMENGGD